jgi:hypothetical protein
MTPATIEKNYHLAWVEVQRVYDALRGYRHHRDHP